MRGLAIALAAALIAGSAGAETLTILHTNDFHSRIEPINKYDSGCSTEDNDAGKCFGGSARLITAVRAAREAAPNSLLVDDSEAKLTGSWTKSTYSKPFIGVGYIHDGKSEKGEKWAEFTRKYSELWPVIITKKDPLPTADEMDGKEGKMELFSEAAGEGG